MIKFLLLIALGLLIYRLFYKEHLKNSKGHVSYQSPDECHKHSSHEKDITDRARILSEEPEADR